MSPLLQPLYTPDSNGVFRLYAGELQVAYEGERHQIAGDIEFELTPSTSLRARFSGDDLWLDEAMFSGKRIEVTIASTSPLTLPTESAVKQHGNESRWIELDPRLNELEAGNIGMCDRFIFHSNGNLSQYPFPEDPADPNGQRHVDFSLPGWNLRICASNTTTKDGSNFTCVVEAVCSSATNTSSQDIEILRRHLFLLFSFICGRETAVGPICGLDTQNNIRWVRWDAPRSRSRLTDTWRWCQESRIPENIPALADGISALVDTPMYKVVDRAINLHLSANGSEVFDVRIPVACTGLELIGWSILQQEGWATPETLERITASAQLRLLLSWAKIPSELPSEFSALAAKRGRLGLPHTSTGPELVTKVRNDLVHPPKRINALEWPASNELTECWQLATWYLELAILRLLGYKGDYRSRLQLSGWDGDVVRVPWA